MAKNSFRMVTTSALIYRMSVRDECTASREVIRVSPADQLLVAEALLNPPEPTDALRKAFARRRELLGVA